MNINYRKPRNEEIVYHIYAMNGILHCNINRKMYYCFYVELNIITNLLTAKDTIH